ncbi:RyR domain-containing protein [Thioalkalivibrio sp. ALE12]|uniref:RyR domain-containing protein n=1 Tax=Thioalkalivibrio sp. ALE12 TaxID=1158170 RepID=UPI000369987A|nr:RyR domain-containing protein [Thioalkalivibrio sp. ALE12]
MEAADYGNVVPAVARVAHEVNRAYCAALGDHSQPEWEDAPDWQKKSAVAGVIAHLERGLTPEESHEEWMRHKVRDGWVYGEEKDPEAKTHPCMVPYDQLSAVQKGKDKLFKAVVESLVGGNHG